MERRALKAKSIAYAKKAKEEAALAEFMKWYWVSFFIWNLNTP